jgi:hypothetical protein
MMADEIRGKRARRAVVERNEHSQARGWSIRLRTARGELQNSMNLFARHAKFFDEFINRHVFQVLEHYRNRRPGAFKYSCAASLAGNALDGGALGPIKSCHVGSLLSLAVF